MSQIPIFTHNPITKANEQNEYRMSNKEFRMTKSIEFAPSFGLRYSLFDILRFAFDSLRNEQRCYKMRFEMPAGFAF
jgi:hypothetical protein